MSKDVQGCVDPPLNPDNGPQLGQVKIQRPILPRPTSLGNAQVPDKENPEMDIYRLFHILVGKTADQCIKAIENYVQLYPECSRSGKLMWD